MRNNVNKISILFLPRKLSKNSNCLFEIELDSQKFESISKEF